MASGTINLTQSNTSGNYIVGKIEWSSAADTAANNSDVTAKLYVRKDSTNTTLTTATSGTWSFSLTVNGTKASGTAKLDVLTDWVYVTYMTVSDIAHDSDGTKSITIGGSVSAPSGSSYAGKTTSGSGTVTLDAIARASSITSATNTSVGSPVKVKWTPASKSFYYKVKLAIGSWAWTSPAIHPNQTSAYTYTSPNISYNAASELPDTPSGTMTATLYTYSDSGCTKQIGSSSSKTFTLTVPNNSTTQPLVTMTLTPVSALPNKFAALYIEGKSKVKATLSATEKYGATIKSYSLKVGGTSYESNTAYTSGYLAPYGSYTVTGYATDSRGYTGAAETSITVIPYGSPKVVAASDESSVVVARCDADGNLSDSGTYLKIKAGRSYSKVISGGVQFNYCWIQFRYKVASEDDSGYSDWETILAGNADADEVETAALLDGVLAVDTSYAVQVRAIDDVGGVDTTTVTLPTAKVYMHRDGRRNSLSIGKYAEYDNTVDVAPDITVRVRGDLLIGDSGVTLKDYILSVIEGG